MIAKNYRRFPEALLYQLELALAGVESTLEYIRVNNRALWLVWTRLLSTAKDDDRGRRSSPAWWLGLGACRRALARQMLAAQMRFPAWS